MAVYAGVRRGVTAVRLPVYRAGMHPPDAHNEEKEEAREGTQAVQQLAKRPSNANSTRWRPTNAA